MATISSKISKKFESSTMMFVSMINGRESPVKVVVHINCVHIERSLKRHNISIVFYTIIYGQRWREARPGDVNKSNGLKKTVPTFLLNVFA